MIKLYSLEEVAHMTGFALRTLQRDARADKFIHVRRGRDRFMTEDQIDALIAQSTTTAPANDTAEDKKAKLMEELRRRRS